MGAPPRLYGIFALAAFMMILSAVLFTNANNNRKTIDLDSAMPGVALQTHAIDMENFDASTMQLLMDIDQSSMSSSQLAKRKGNKKSDKKKKKNKTKSKGKRSPKAKKLPKAGKSPKKIAPNYPIYATIANNEFTYSSGATEQPGQLVVEDWRQS